LAAKPKLIDFEVEEEPWNKYEISDQTILKTRYILKTVTRSMVNGKNNYSGDGIPLTIIMVPGKLKGQPDTKKYSPKDIQASIDKPDMKFRISHEDWNEYRLDDGATIRMKSTLTNISRTKLFDAKGDPIYYVLTNMMIQVKEPNIGK